MEKDARRTPTSAAKQLIFSKSSGSKPSMDVPYYIFDYAATIYLEHVRQILRLLFQVKV
jgi:hypothetical protein